MMSKRTDGSTISKLKEALEQEARGSDTEAIGTLLGDDAIRERGTAERQAGEDKAAVTAKSVRP